MMTPPIDHPEHPAHTPEEVIVIVRFHRDGTACVEVEYPDHRTDEEMRQVVAMAAEAVEVPGALAVTRSGHLVQQRRGGD